MNPAALGMMFLAIIFGIAMTSDLSKKRIEESEQRIIERMEELHERK